MSYIFLLFGICTRLHGVTSQKTVTSIVQALKTSTVEYRRVCQDWWHLNADCTLCLSSVTFTQLKYTLLSNH